LQIMSTVFGSTAGPAAPSVWDAQLGLIERMLDQLDSAFAQGDPQGVAASAQGLHEALSAAMVTLRRAPAPQPVLSAALVRRLTFAQARARAHQDAVMRGRVAAERALSVLIEHDTDTSTYQSLGGSVASRMAALYR
jgi:hypothetical protein